MPLVVPKPQNLLFKRLSVPRKNLQNDGSCAADEMTISRELEFLLRRAERITVLQRPPKLELAVVNDGDELPPPSPWRMSMVIQPKLKTPSNSTDRDLHHTHQGLA